MSETSICILCEKEAEKSGIQGRDGYLIECETCGKYFLGSPEIFEGSYKMMPREERAMISAYTREFSRHEEKFLELGDGVITHPAGYSPSSMSWTEIIEKYHNKSENEKLKNLVSYIKNESKQFGDRVLLDGEKDYPITYSLSSQEFTTLRDIAIKRDILTRASSGAGFELTEKGWKMALSLSTN